jgi:hypothetical protein
MKLTDLYVLIKIADNTLKIVYMGKYDKCALMKNPDDNTELILKAGQVININIS